LKRLFTKEKELSTKGHEGRRRATKGRRKNNFMQISVIAL
jgi:hypothetical protein